MIRLLAPIVGLAAFALGAANAFAAEKFDPRTEEPLMDLFRANTDSVPLEPRDPSRNLTTLYRDCSSVEGRDPGPIDIQRTVGGTGKMGIPTFFRAPVRFVRRT